MAKKVAKKVAAKANGKAKRRGDGPAPKTKSPHPKAGKQAPDSASRTLRMDLRHDNENTEVIWSVPGRPAKGAEPKEGEPGYIWDGYYVSAGNIDRLGESIRKRLQALQGLDWRVSANAVEGDANAFGPILTKLVEDGRDLHAAILRGVDGEQLSERRSARFRAWFEKNVLDAPLGVWRIEVVHAKFSKSIAPWALACVPMSMDAVAALDPRKPEHYRNFWGARFKVAVRGNTADVKDGADERNGENMRLACVLELDAHAVTKLESRGGRVGESEAMRRHLGWEKDAYHALAQRYMRFDLFWYLSLQADAGSFVIGEDEISSADLEANKTQNTDRVVLMMLDGDAVVRGDRGPDWVKNALDIGRSGLIAVEADLRNPQVRHFGWRILRHVLKSRKPLLDAMDEARTLWWPLGLLYGIYCSPVHTAVTPPPEETIQKVDEWIDIIGAIQPVQHAEKPS